MQKRDLWPTVQFNSHCTNDVVIMAQMWNNRFQRQFSCASRASISIYWLQNHLFSCLFPFMDGYWDVFRCCGCILLRWQQQMYYNNGICAMKHATTMVNKPTIAIQKRDLNGRRVQIHIHTDTPNRLDSWKAWCRERKRLNIYIYWMKCGCRNCSDLVWLHANSMHLHSTASHNTFYIFVCMRMFDVRCSVNGKH